jgi:hypothetical protein
VDGVGLFELAPEQDASSSSPPSPSLFPDSKCKKLLLLTQAKSREESSSSSKSLENLTDLIAKARSEVYTDPERKAFQY